jgi:hypothetical protein
MSSCASIRRDSIAGTSSQPSGARSIRVRDQAGVANGNAAQGLHPLGDLVDDLELLAGVFVQQQMQLVEGRAPHQPVMLLGQGMEDLRVGEDLVQPPAA